MLAPLLVLDRRIMRAPTTSNVCYSIHNSSSPSVLLSHSTISIGKILKFAVITRHHSTWHWPRSTTHDYSSTLLPLLSIQTSAKLHPSRSPLQVQHLILFIQYRPSRNSYLTIHHTPQHVSPPCISYCAIYPLTKSSLFSMTSDLDLNSLTDSYGASTDPPSNT